MTVVRGVVEDVGVWLHSEGFVRLKSLQVSWTRFGGAEL